MEYKGYSITTRVDPVTNKATSKAKKGKSQPLFSKKFSGSSGPRRSQAHCRRMIDAKDG